MGARSVTGAGLGISNGKQKPGNNCGCGCASDPVEKTPPVKIGCVTPYKTGGTKTIKVGKSSSIKVCT